MLSFDRLEKQRHVSMFRSFPKSPNMGRNLDFQTFAARIIQLSSSAPVFSRLRFRQHPSGAICPSCACHPPVVLDA